MNGLDGTVGDLMTLPKSQYSVMERGGFQGLWKEARLPGSVFFGEGNPLVPGSAIIVHSALMHGACPPLPPLALRACARALTRPLPACREGAEAWRRRQATLLHRLVVLPAVRLPGPQVARRRQRPLDRQAPRPGGGQVRRRVGHEQVLQAKEVRRAGTPTAATRPGAQAAFVPPQGGCSQPGAGVAGQWPRLWQYVSAARQQMPPIRSPTYCNWTLHTHCGLLPGGRQCRQLSLFQSAPLMNLLR